ncbi:MAG: endonuclease [Flavobacteriaceae bacterium]|nr:endonuclease [Flavobacteriaceae bacterium]
MIKKLLVFLLLITSGILVAQETYYNGVDFSLNGMALKAVLSAKISSNNTPLPYTSSSYDVWNADKDSDEDPNNTNNVILIYNGQSEPKTNTEGDDNIGTYPKIWNREHVFPKSLATPKLNTDNPGPGTDMHNIRACNKTVNTARDNAKFIDGSGSYSGNTTYWYPGDEFKGDVARMVMYMYLRYDGNGSSIAETQCLPKNVGVGNPVSNDSNMIDLFLQWNADDPVSEIERQRNVISEEKQGNRNPFIDNPYLATKIWGGPAAEDTWGTLGTEELLLADFHVFPIPSYNHSIVIESDKEAITEVKLYNSLGQLFLTYKSLDKNNKPIILDNLPSGFYVLKMYADKGMASTRVVVH